MVFDLAVFFYSQLLFVALCCWNVLCFPAKEGKQLRFKKNVLTPFLPFCFYPLGPWLQPNEEVRPHRSSRAARAPVSRLHHPVVAYVVRYSPGAYPTTSSLPLDMSSEAPWRAPPVWDPVEESAATFRRSQPRPNVAPPLFFQAGELDRYVANSEPGTTEGLIFLAPPPPSYPGMSGLYASEPGIGEWETEDRMPPPPYASAPLGVEVSAASSTFTASPVPLEPPPGGRGQHYLF